VVVEKNPRRESRDLPSQAKMVGLVESRGLCW
jgi:hypothetical protein